MTRWLFLAIVLMVCMPSLIALTQRRMYFDEMLENYSAQTCPSMPPPPSSPYGMYDNFKNHPCKRECIAGQPMVCHYYLFIHEYRTLGPECNRCLTDRMACEAEHCIYGDGLNNTLMLANHHLPSPTIEVCGGDTLVVTIYNNLTEPTTQHWHGIHQCAYPESDGAPMVTQYPIQPGDTKVVTFLADRCGTLWYHSHSGTQRALGVAGRFTVHCPKDKNPHYHLYDIDDSKYSIILHDIAYNKAVTPPQNILVNGMGRNQVVDWPDNDPRHRYAHFIVRKYYRYRFRLVHNGVSNCPIAVSCDGHNFIVIALDGNDIKPVIANTVHVHAGERVDVILTANQPLGTYWFTFQGINDCANIKQRAILRYQGVPYDQMPQDAVTASATESRAVVVNAVWETRRSWPSPSHNIGNVGVISGLDIPTIGLESLTPTPWTGYENFHNIYLHLGIRVFNRTASLQINDIGNQPPALAMLQGCALYRDDDVFCNATSLANQNIDCTTTLCKCTHVIHVPAHRLVRVVVGNLMNSTHPVHIHGYTFKVVGQGSLGSRNLTEQIETLHRSGDPRIVRIDTKKKNAVEKDVVQLPPLGYIMFEYYSGNPGYWMLHCHIERHAEAGMLMVFKVGERCKLRNNEKVNCQPFDGGRGRMYKM